MKTDTELYKQNVISVVDAYKKIYNDEYREVVKIVKEKRKNMKYETAKTDKGIDTLDRALLEYPETLYDILNTRLAPIEMVWLSSKDGARWFAKQYKEFSLAEII